MAQHDYDLMDEPPGGWPEPPPDPAEEAYDAWLEGLLDWATAAEVPDEPERDLIDVVTDVAAGGQQPPAEWQGFRIGSDADAERAIARYARAQNQVAELEAQARAWTIETEDRLARIRQWFEHRARRPRATMAFLQAHLVAYALDRRAEDPKHNKTLVLPSGAVRTIEQRPKVAVADETAVVGWAEASLDPDVLQDVAPVQPRKLYVQPLRDHLRLVEVVDHAKLVLANSAEVIEWRRVDRGPVCPGVGDGWPTSEDAEDLVARVEVLVSHLEVHGPDGEPVPGCYVEPGQITAKVVPS